MASLAGYNPNASLLPSGGGTIQPMSGGGMDAPPGYNATASLLPSSGGDIAPFRGGFFTTSLVGGVPPNDPVTPGASNPAPAPAPAPPSANSQANSSGANAAPTFTAPSTLATPVDPIAPLTPVTPVESVTPVALIAPATPATPVNSISSATLTVPVSNKTDESHKITLFNKELSLENPQKLSANVKNKGNFSGAYLEALELLGVDGPAVSPKEKIEILQALYNGNCNMDAPLAMLQPCEPVRRIVQTLALNLLGKIQPVVSNSGKPKEFGVLAKDTISNVSKEEKLKLTLQDKGDGSLVICLTFEKGQRGLISKELEKLATNTPPPSNNSNSGTSAPTSTSASVISPPPLTNTRKAKLLNGLSGIFPGPENPEGVKKMENLIETVPENGKLSDGDMDKLRNITSELEKSLNDAKKRKDLTNIMEDIGITIASNGSPSDASVPEPAAVATPSEPVAPVASEPVASEPVATPSEPATSSLTTNNIIGGRGIENKGAFSCYCISAVQLLFSIIEVREEILKYDCSKITIDDLNSTLESIQNEIDSKIPEKNSKEIITYTNKDKIFCALQHIFNELNMGLTNFNEFNSYTPAMDNTYVLYLMKNFIAYRNIINKKMKNPLPQEDLKRYQDAEEFIKMLLLLFENTSQLKNLKDMFSYKYNTITSCETNTIGSNNTKRSEEETIATVQLLDKSYFNLQSELDKKLEPESVELERCKDKRALHSSSFDITDNKYLLILITRTEDNQELVTPLNITISNTVYKLTSVILHNKDKQHYTFELFNTNNNLPTNNIDLSGIMSIYYNDDAVTKYDSGGNTEMPIKMDSRLILYSRTDIISSTIDKQNKSKTINEPNLNQFIKSLDDVLPTVTFKGIMHNSTYITNKIKYIINNIQDWNESNSIKKGVVENKILETCVDLIMDIKTTLNRGKLTKIDATNAVKLHNLLLDILLAINPLYVNKTKEWKKIDTIKNYYNNTNKTNTNTNKDTNTNTNKTNTNTSTNKDKDTNTNKDKDTNTNTNNAKEPLMNNNSLKEQPVVPKTNNKTVAKNTAMTTTTEPSAIVTPKNTQTNLTPIPLTKENIGKYADNTIKNIRKKPRPSSIKGTQDRERNVTTITQTKSRSSPNNAARKISTIRNKYKLPVNETRFRPKNLTGEIAKLETKAKQKGIQVKGGAQKTFKKSVAFKSPKKGTQKKRHST